MYEPSSTKMATAINGNSKKKPEWSINIKIYSGNWLGKLRTGWGGLFTGGIEFLFTAIGKIN